MSKGIREVAALLARQAKRSRRQATLLAPLCAEVAAYHLGRADALDGAVSRLESLCQDDSDNVAQS